MAPSNVELYEALKPTIGEDAARMIAEVVPPTRELATKGDIEALRHATKAEVDGLRGDMREGFAQARVDAHAERVSLLKWMIALMVPAWAGTWATVVAVVLKF